jgi:hypothetical protein
VLGGAPAIGVQHGTSAETSMTGSSVRVAMGTGPLRAS